MTVEAKRASRAIAAASVMLSPVVVSTGRLATIVCLSILLGALAALAAFAVVELCAARARPRG